MRCRLNAPLMVLAYRDNHQAATTIPAGRTIDILGPDQDDRFSIIGVNGQKFLAFEDDVRERGTALIRQEEETVELLKLKHASGQ